MPNSSCCICGGCCFIVVCGEKHSVYFRCDLGDDVITTCVQCCVLFHIWYCVLDACIFS